MKKDSTENLVTSLFKLSRALRRLTDDSPNLHDLSSAQLSAMMFIKEQKDPKMSEISAYFKIALPSATALADRLVKHGLVKRVLDSHDRRSVKIKLTAKGMKVSHQAISRKIKSIRKMLALLSKKDSQDLQRIINELLSKLEKSENN